MDELKLSGTVRLVCLNVIERDAVGNFCFDIHRLLKAHQIPVAIYTDHCDSHHRDWMRPESEIEAESTNQDIILYFHSIYDPYLPQVLTAKAKKKIVYFHGITDPVFFRESNPALSRDCEKGYEQMALLKVFDAFASNSLKTGSLLAKYAGISPDSISAIPPKISFDLALLPKTQTSTKNILLYVGRLKAHKKIEDILKVFSCYVKRDNTAELWIVGGQDDAAYVNFLKKTESDYLGSYQHQVKWQGFVSDEALKDIYASATAYISMSEDEGFCVPLVEAMQADLPVFAYGIPAVREVLNGAGRCFDHKRYEAIAEEIDRVLNNEALLEEVKMGVRAQSALMQVKMNGESILHLLLAS